MRRLAAAFLAVLLVAALPTYAYLTKPREAITSTPSSFTGVTAPIAVPAGAEACADLILYDPRSQRARFGAAPADGTPAPPLEIVARGDRTGEYRSAYVSTARVPGGWTAEREISVPLDPPGHDTFGTFCVRNDGAVPVSLLGTENGRAFSRPTVTVDGEAQALDLQLTLTEARPRSILARVGDMARRGARLNPLGPWWWWVLALTLAVGAPLLVLAAARSALLADTAAGRDRAPVGSVALPFARARRRLAGIPGWLLVAAAGAAAVAWYAYWGWNTHVFQHDEDQYVYLSRWLQHELPEALWSFDFYGRGLQRLEVWLLAIPSALFDSPWSLMGGRLLNAVAFVSTAIPVYLLGRELSLGPRWAALPAALSAVVPWAVVTTGFLTENVAYPACLWAIWAVYRTLVAPSAGRDGVALALLLVAGAARSGLVLLAPVLPVAVLLVGLRYNPGSLSERLRTAIRSHAVLWVAVAAAALALIAGSAGLLGPEGLTRRLAGSYATPLGFDVGTLSAKLARYLSRVVVGTGFLPAAVALPWLALEIARPRDIRRHALALTFAGATVALLYSLNAAGPDERYILYLAPLVLLPATLAVAHREVSPVGVALTSVLLAALLLRTPWVPEQGPFGFFVSPVEMFYSRAVGLRLATYVPGDADFALTLVGVAFGAAGVALAAMLRWAPSRLGPPAAGVMIAAVAALILVQTDYALTKYVNGAGSKAAAGLPDRAFVDRTVPDGARVAAFTEGVGQRPEFFPIWQEVQFYNERIDAVYSLGDLANPVPPGDEVVAGVGFDERTGRVRSPVGLPDYVVASTHVGRVGLRGEVVAAPSHVAVALLRLHAPATLAWRVSGMEPYGGVPPHGAGEIRFYGAGLEPGRQCATLGLAAPVDAGTDWRVRLPGRAALKGELEPGGTRTLRLELPRLVERGAVDARVDGDALQVRSISVGGC